MQVLELNKINNYREKMYIFLKLVDTLFKIPLSKKVNLLEYIDKFDKVGKAYIAYKDDKIVGAIVYYDNSAENKKAYISLVAVLEDYQNKGIAKILMKKILNNLKNINIRVIGIHTDNKKALVLYKKLEFQVISEDNERYYLERINL